MNKIYVVGAMKFEYKSKFDAAKALLESQGNAVLSYEDFPEGFSRDDCMHVCLAKVDICDELYVLTNLGSSQGTQECIHRAVLDGKKITYQEAAEC